LTLLSGLRLGISAGAVRAVPDDVGTADGVGNGSTGAGNEDIRELHNVLDHQWSASSAIGVPCLRGRIRERHFLLRAGADLWSGAIRTKRPRADERIGGG